MSRQSMVSSSMSMAPSMPDSEASVNSNRSDLYVSIRGVQGEIQHIDLCVMYRSRLACAVCASLSSLTHSVSGSERVFPSRWDAENEMDKSLNILKRKQAATLRLRKMHTVHDRLLEGKLRVLNTSFDHLSKELKKETKTIQAEIGDTTPTLLLPRIGSSKSSIVDSRSQSRLSDTNTRCSRSSSQQSGVCNSCHYDPTNSERCKHFPCYLPMTYNSIGFVTRASSYSRTGNYRRLLQRCRDLRPSTSQVQNDATVNEHSQSELFDSKAPRTTVKEKIRGLKILVKEMKERNEKTKPKEWAVKYGEPIPRRFILTSLKSGL